MSLVSQMNKPKWITTWKVAMRNYYNSFLPNWYVYKEDIF